jgi:FkbM family methyltransferase
MRPPGRVRDHVPWWFPITRRLPAKRWAAYSWLQRRGHLADTVRVPFHDATVFMPMHEHQCWQYADLAEADALSTDNLAALVRARFDRWTMVDCGANAGLFTMNMARKAPGLERVEAIEPNPMYGPVLRSNLGLLGGVAGAVHLAAVADYSGRGRLVAPEDDDSPHSMFLAPDPTGPIAVTRLDDLGIPPGGSLVLKLDIEGAEYAALAGARELLRSAAGFILFVEFHAGVLARTGQNPRALFDLVATISPPRWVDAEDPSREIDITRPVLEQTLNRRICDVIGLPHPRWVDAESDRAGGRP